MGVTIKIPFTSVTTYTKEGVQAVSASVAAETVDRGKRDALQLFYKGALPAGAYTIMEPVYSFPWWYAPLFTCELDAASARIMVTTGNHANLVQKGLAFEPSAAAGAAWSPGNSVLTKISFETTGADAGKMYVSVGTESQFTGGSQAVMKSTEVLLNATHIAAYSGGTLRVEQLALRLLFRPPK